jgi:hypothetical protein
MTRDAMRDVELPATKQPGFRNDPPPLMDPATTPETEETDTGRTARTQCKILFLAVNGADRNLGLDDEYRAIDEATGRRDDLFMLVSKWALQRDELQQGLLQHRPNVVHFGGHGTQAGELVLRDPDGGLAPVSADALQALFGALHDNIQVVVLNACFSAIQAAAIRDSVGIVIGMRRQISDRAAIAFTRAFYEALVYGESVRKAFDLGIAAIRTQGLSEEADIPELLVRAGINASKVILIIVHTEPERITIRPGPSVAARLFAFVVLLLAALVLAVLFGSGVLRQDAVSEYVVFVVLGGLAAVVTWGILSSTGELKGRSYGIDAKVTGSLVPFILIVGGGLWLRTSEQEFSVKIKFLDGAGQPARISGLLRLEAKGHAYPAMTQPQKADLVEVTQLPHGLGGSRARVVLESDAFQISKPDQEYDLHPTQMIEVRVHPKTKLSGTVTLAGTRLTGGKVLVAGSNCGGDIRDGYFELLCGDLAPPVKVEIQAPEVYAGQICKREHVLDRLANNQITLAGCPGIKIATPVDHAHVDPGFPVDVSASGEISGINLTVADHKTWIASPGPYRVDTDKTLEGDQQVTAEAIVADSSPVTASVHVTVRAHQCWVPRNDVHATPTSVRKKKCPQSCIDSTSPSASVAVPKEAFHSCVKVCLCG